MIRSKQYCDICEHQLGEEHPDALIPEVKDRPAFPQLIWTFFRSGYQCLVDATTGEPSLVDKYFGKTNQLEFCQKHGIEANVLLKYFSLGDTRILKTLDELMEEDSLNWQKRDHKAEEEFETAMEHYQESKNGSNGHGEHAESTDHHKDGGSADGKARGGPDSK